MRFLVDASCPRRIVLRLREFGHDTDYAVAIDPPAWATGAWQSWGMGEGFFLRLQDSYDLMQAERKLGAELDKIVLRVA